ncbi:hypothetical protein Poli38472_009073 [Pythium oligandrum]|uniref:USP domain-containing protein n=1 Tax=Pythium oligandrum TaxID=41045 RepID=A0A8K1FJG8_PYTOL|nr:hypothetical protein Poli38472_009073 [Pythium oligandrum]|eukprot:TMW64906.1 hypothetical protein Poli38472_009073 [Pythium oligandrum]
MGMSAAFTDDDDVERLLRESPLADPLSTTPTPSSSPSHDDLLGAVSPTHAQHGGDDDDLDDDLDAHYQSLSMQDDDDLDVDDNQLHAHRQRLGNALAQLPRKRQNDEYEDTAASMGFASQTAQDEGYDYFFDSPSASPTAASSSTALIVASSATVGPVQGPSLPSNASAGRPAYAASRRVRNPYTGLSNQGATCYMNSLLQTMFMTPELRLGLYRWMFQGDDDDEPEEDNIPFQLQKLFAKLQMNTMDSLSTKALTKSFGWTGADVFQQHDVQELCRVLFDALEKSFKGTVNETLVNDLYQGTMKDYVQCCTCGYESSRIDEFLDLSLVIRPFGSTKMMKSVDEAIEFFLKPELLNGDNQWMCDRCQTKRDAIKGLKFSKLPYLLSLQLKRFDYDYMTDSRIKLHDRVAFPKYLDMNSYVHDEDGARGSIARKMSMERHELGAPSDSRTRRMSSMDESQAMAFDDLDGDITADEDTWSPSFDVNTMLENSGPYVYELYSVLIHSGSALGGHYYAYIKSLESDKWFDFNDSMVSEMSEHEVKKAFGGNGSSSGYGARMSHSTCAYMLMYRLISKDKNINVIPKESIPPYLTDRLREEEERQRRQEFERQELAKKMLLKFYMRTGKRSDKIELSLHVYKTAPLKEALVLAHEAFTKELGADVVPSIENTRLRVFNSYTSVLSDAFEGKEDRSLQSLQMYSSYQLYLETKREDEEWEPYVSSRLQLFIRRYGATDEGGIDWSARYIQVDEEGTIGTLADVVRSKFNVSEGKQIRFIRKTGSSYTATQVKVLNRDASERTNAQRLRYDLHLVNGTDVFFEECDDLADVSPAEAQFEREINMISVQVHYVDRPMEELVIDRRETVRTLKERIGDRMGLSIEQFKLLRGNHRAGIEIKTIDTVLFKVPISHGSAMFALEGVPLNVGEYLFRLMLHKPMSGSLSPSVFTDKAKTTNDEGSLTVVSSKTTPGEASTDVSADLFDLDEVNIRTTEEENELIYIGNVKVGEDMFVDEIRRNVWSVLNEKGALPEEPITLDQIRLRDLQVTTMRRILVDGWTFRDASTTSAYEGRGIVAQIVPAPEKLPPAHRVLHVVYVDRSQWRFSKKRRFELILEADNDDEVKNIEEDEQDGAQSSNFGERAVNEIAARLVIPPEQLRFAIFPYDRDTYDICEIFKTDFDTWDRCISALNERTPNYQLLVFATDVDVPMASFSLRERSMVQDFLVRKRDENSRADRYNSYYSGSSYQKPKEAALVIRTKSKASDKKNGGGSTASSTGGRSTGGVSIRTPTRRDTNKAAGNSDTDDEEDEFLSKPTANDDVDMDLYD